MPQFLNYFNHPSNFRQGGITASILAGAFAGSLLTGAFLADRLGRRKTILLGSAIFTIGCAISAAANNVEALVAGRVINGLGNGCLTMMVRWIALCYEGMLIEIGYHVPKRDCAERVCQISPLY